MPGEVSSTHTANIVILFSIPRKEKEAGVLSPSTGSTRIPLGALLVAVHVGGVRLMWEECFQWMFPFENSFSLASFTPA